ncbi:glycolate oxidase FAD binding subunit [Roseivivax lentus]|uniref:Glycolate oxidase FAD binding subunit n=1 Tax=Roseivivax lentus TaxID=633194 RepID=A0A1N7JWR3_9RHOB|nr:FAD-binding protein [Roseivivax lentus]SIS53773.1 glycolate oxidase FAD binding subunit [Roseivivax lentus]
MTPKTEDELSEIIKAARDPLQIRGGGTRGGAGTGALLETGGLSGISLYEPGALTLVAGAGTPLAEIDTALARENQRLAFEPLDHRTLLGSSGEPTLGGVAATNASGPRRIQVGAARDFMLGVRFVDGAGNIVKNGGRVMKNVTGYDLVKLMAGSWGQLGVMTEVSLKVLPVPEMIATLLINGLNETRAVAAMSRALGSPFEITGAAHAPRGVDGHPVTMLRIEGFETQITYRAGELKKLLAEFGDIAVETDQDRVAAGWAWVRDVALMKDKPGDVWRFSVKPSDGPKLAAALGAEDILLDWGGGLVWARMPEGTDARTKMGDIAGHGTLVRMSDGSRGRIPRLHPEPAPVAKLTDGLRARFDPRGLFNLAPVPA